jgi:molybdate transport system substrate-binding protein
MMIKRFAAVLVWLLISASAHAEPVRIMAAFTFKSALDEVIRTYEAASGGDVLAIYGPTPALAKQVENLAPADIFLSADPNWMNYLQERGLIRIDSRVNLLATDLVLATRNDNSVAPTDARITRDYPLERKSSATGSSYRRTSQ